MKHLTNIKYTIFSPNGSEVERGCIRKFFHGAFRRIKYLKRVYGSLIKFDKDDATGNSIHK